MNRKEVTRPLFGIDIGGTLTKCVYFEPCHCDTNPFDVLLDILPLSDRLTE